MVYLKIRFVKLFSSRFISGLGAFFSCIIFIPSLLNAQIQKVKKPNVIVILTDDMGYSDIGCFGSEIRTPNIDRLAANGISFTHFYNTARCSPTRASLLTGLYPHQAGMGHLSTENFKEPGYTDDLSKNAVTMAEVFQQAGYATYMTGKWHIAKSITDDGKVIQEHLFEYIKSGWHREVNKVMKHTKNLERFINQTLSIAKEKRIVFNDCNTIFEEVSEQLKTFAPDPNTKYVAIYISSISKLDKEHPQHKAYYKIKELLLYKDITSQVIFSEHLPKEEFWQKLEGFPGV